MHKTKSCIHSIHLCHVGTGFAPFRFFYAEKSVTHAVVPPLSQKARSARLFACKRAHNGSQSLPPFCEMRLRREYFYGSVLPRRSKLYIACSDFLCKKNKVSAKPILSLPLKRKAFRNDTQVVPYTFKCNFAKQPREIGRFA